MEGWDDFFPEFGERKVTNASSELVPTPSTSSSSSPVVPSSASTVASSSQPPSSLVISSSPMLSSSPSSAPTKPPPAPLSPMAFSNPPATPSKPPPPPLALTSSEAASAHETSLTEPDIVAAVAPSNPSQLSSSSSVSSSSPITSAAPVSSSSFSFSSSSSSLSSASSVSSASSSPTSSFPPSVNTTSTIRPSLLPSPILQETGDKVEIERLTRELKQRDEEIERLRVSLQELRDHNVILQAAVDKQTQQPEVDVKALQTKVDTLSVELLTQQAVLNDALALTWSSDVAEARIDSKVNPPCSGVSVHFLLTPAPAEGYTVQWSRSFAGSLFEKIEGASSATYVPTADDIGAVLKGKVSSPDGGYTEAEAGPVMVKKEVAEKLVEFLKKGAFNLDVDIAAQGGASTLVVTKKNLKLKVGRKTDLLGELGPGLRVDLVQNDKFCVKSPHWNTEHTFTAPRDSRDLYVLALRLLNSYIPENEHDNSTRWQIVTLNASKLQGLAQDSQTLRAYMSGEFEKKWERVRKVLGGGGGSLSNLPSSSSSSSPFSSSAHRRAVSASPITSRPALTAERKEMDVILKKQEEVRKKDEEIRKLVHEDERKAFIEEKEVQKEITTTTPTTTTSTTTTNNNKKEVVEKKKDQDKQKQKEKENIDNDMEIKTPPPRELKYDAEGFLIVDETERGFTSYESNKHNSDSDEEEKKPHFKLAIRPAEGLPPVSLGQKNIPTLTRPESVGQLTLPRSNSKKKEEKKTLKRAQTSLPVIPLAELAESGWAAVDAFPAMQVDAFHEVKFMLNEIINVKIRDGAVDLLDIRGELNLSRVGSDLTQRTVPFGFRGPMKKIVANEPSVVSLAAANGGSSSSSGGGNYTAKFIDNQDALCALKYIVDCDTQIVRNPLPLLAKVVWDCKPLETIVEVIYDINPKYKDALSGIKFLFNVTPPSAVSKCVLPKGLTKAQGLWNPKTQQLMWKLPQAADKGRLLFRLATTVAVIPSQMDVFFTGDLDESLAGVILDVKSTDTLQIRKIHSIKAGMYSISPSSG